MPATEDNDGLVILSTYSLPSTSNQSQKNEDPGEDSKIDAKKNVTTENSNKKCFNCSVCGKGFQSRSVMEQHMRCHAGHLAFECRQCEQSFALYSNLQKHIKKQHKPRPHVCDICNKGFLTNSYLKSHLMLHTGEKPYECKDCDKRFTQRGHLDAHTKTTHNPNPVRHQCKLCPKSYARVRNLRNHMYSHQDNPLFCKVCMMGFSRFKCAESHAKCQAHHTETIQKEKEAQDVEEDEEL